MSETIIIGGSRHVVSVCITCGVVHTVPERVYSDHRDEGGYHFCPNGHSYGWSKEKSERERLRRERDRLAQTIAQKDDEIAEQRKEIIAKKAVITRLNNRAKAGLCSCCNRHFTNLERHMKSKHSSPPKLAVVNS